MQTRRPGGIALGQDVAVYRAGRLSLAWAVVAFGAALLIFGLTAAPDLTWAHGGYDGGELITASYTLGIPHPPGYPTYVVLGKLFSAIPLGTIAFRYHLFSATAVAIASGLATLILIRLGKDRLSPATAAALALGIVLLPPVWAQATIAEVYGLNLALVAVFLFALLVLKRPTLAGLSLGLAVTTHPTSLLLLPLALALTPRAGWSRMAVGFLLGLTPLLLLPVLATGSSPVIWGDPADLAGWWWLVSGQLYSANLGLPADLLTSPALPGGVAILVVAVLAWAHNGRQRRNAARDEDKAGPVSVTGGLAAVAVLYVLFAWLYRVPDAGVFLLPAYLLAGLAIGPTLGRLGPLLWLAPGLLLLLAGWSQHDLRGQTAVRPHAEAILNKAPNNAILLTPGDRTIFTLWYFQHVEGQRPDLTLVDAGLFAFAWYRARLGGSQQPLVAVAEDDLAAFRSANGTARPICTTHLVGPGGEPRARLDCTAANR